jgi:hypothetical protein
VPPLLPPLFISQGGDDVSECEEALVDIDSLLEGLALGPRPFGPFAPSKVDEVELGGEEDALGVDSLDRDREDGVRTRRGAAM